MGSFNKYNKNSTPHILEKTNIITNMQHKAIYDIYRSFERGDLQLYPIYQRDFSFSNRQKTNIIESLLMGIPIPPIYLNEREDFKFEVISGKEVLEAIFGFLKGEYALQDTYMLPEFEGCFFDDLSIPYRRKIGDYGIITFILIVEAEEMIKREIFRTIHLNLTNPPLTNQQQRRYFYEKEELDFIQRLSQLPTFQEYGFSNTGNKDEELILRFLAFYLQGYENYHGNFREFLDTTVLCLGKYVNEYRNIEAVFKDTLATLNIVFDNQPFRKNQDRRNPLNRSLFDILTVSFAKADRKLIIKDAKYIRDLLRERMAHQEFYQSITTSTTTKRAVNTRFIKWFSAMQPYMEEYK